MQSYFVHNCLRMFTKKQQHTNTHTFVRTSLFLSRQPNPPEIRCSFSFVFTFFLFLLFLKKKHKVVSELKKKNCPWKKGWVENWAALAEMSECDISLFFVFYFFRGFAPDFSYKKCNPIFLFDDTSTWSGNSFIICVWMMFTFFLFRGGAIKTKPRGIFLLFFKTNIF